MNEKFQEYKANFFNFDIGVVEFDTEGIRQAKKIQFQEPTEIIRIKAYDTTPEEYEKYIQEKRKKQYAKFGEEYTPQEEPLVDAELQRQIFEDNLDEMRLDR